MMDGRRGARTHPLVVMERDLANSHVARFLRGTRVGPEGEIAIPGGSAERGAP